MVCIYDFMFIYFYTQKLTTFINYKCLIIYHFATEIYRYAHMMYWLDIVKTKWERPISMVCYNNTVATALRTRSLEKKQDMLKKTVTARETVTNSAQLKKVWQNELIVLYIPSLKSEKSGIQTSGVLYSKFHRLSQWRTLLK